MAHDEMPEAQPPAPAGDERTWATLCHLAAGAHFVLPTLGNIIGPLIVWLVKRNVYPLVDQQGKESLNFQISISLYTWLTCACLFMTCVGWIVIPVAVIGWTLFDVVQVLIAAMKCSRGQTRWYPLTIRFLT